MTDRTEDHPAKMTERLIEITLLPDRARGPGGHWLGYRAVYCDDPNGPIGYGTTLREARLDLQKQSMRSDIRTHKSLSEKFGQDAPPGVGNVQG